MKDFKKEIEKLDELSYKVTQEGATEKPFENEYDKYFGDGIYVDKVSGEILFSSKDKFNSGCGWPAFSKTINEDEVKELLDTSGGRTRVEVKSKTADSHLGHLFTDGPKALGGLRYCINSASLIFISKEDMREKGYEEYLTLFDS